jgi:hypothetical protein
LGATASGGSQYVWCPVIWGPDQRSVQKQVSDIVLGSANNTFMLV